MGLVYMCVYNLIILGTPGWEREDHLHRYPVAIIFASWAVSHLGDKALYPSWLNSWIENVHHIMLVFNHPHKDILGILNTREWKGIFISVSQEYEKRALGTNLAKCADDPCVASSLKGKS